MEWKKMNGDRELKKTDRKEEQKSWKSIENNSHIISLLCHIS